MGQTLQKRFSDTTLSAKRESKKKKSNFEISKTWTRNGNFRACCGRRFALPRRHFGEVFERSASCRRRGIGRGHRGGADDLRQRNRRQAGRTRGLRSQNRGQRRIRRQNRRVGGSHAKN